MQSATAPEGRPALEAAAAPEGGFDILRLGAVTAGHVANDAYMGFLYPLLPLLVEKHGLSLALTGLLISSFNATGSLSQPLFGFYADKVRRRSFVVAGPVVTGLFVSGAGLAPSYAVLLLLMVLGGLGSGCFHPAGITMAGLCSGRRRGLGLAVFVAGGRVGVAMGSALATFLAARWGLEGSAWAVLVALAAGLLLWAASPPLGPPPPAEGRHLRGALANLGRARWPLFLLCSISVLRATVAVGMGAFLPLYFVERGASLAVAGASVSVFLFSGALG
ncbi:MAG: MFS transporter, partial [Nitrospinota bacterium]